MLYPLSAIQILFFVENSFKRSTIFTSQPPISSSFLDLSKNLEANNISKNQAAFQTENPHIDGLELLGGDITIFPESIHKLSISNKSDVMTFVRNNKGYNFREWTTDTTKLNSIYQT